MTSQPPRPDFIRHWTALEGADDGHYPNSDELLSIGAPLARMRAAAYPGEDPDTLPAPEDVTEPFVRLARADYTGPARL